MSCKRPRVTGKHLLQHAAEGHFAEVALRHSSGVLRVNAFHMRRGFP